MDVVGSFYDQWKEDWDGYMRCTYCGLKCLLGIPKRCRCIGYINESGDIVCKACETPMEDVEDKCPNYPECAQDGFGYPE